MSANSLTTRAAAGLGTRCNTATNPATSRDPKQGNRIRRHHRLVDLPNQIGQPGNNRLADLPQTLAPLRFALSMPS